jgi:hypothetical protein
LFAKLLLILNGLTFIIYGLACAFDPSLPAGYIGMELGQAGGHVEFLAMYGGLQTALGIFFLYCGLHSGSRMAGLKCLALFFGGLGLARLVGLLTHGVDNYNLAAACYELGVALLALWALKILTPAAQNHQ